MIFCPSYVRGRGGGRDVQNLDKLFFLAFARFGCNLTLGWWNLTDGFAQLERNKRANVMPSGKDL